MYNNCGHSSTGKGNADFGNFFFESKDIFIVSNRQGSIVFSNPAAAEKLGYLPQELLSMSVCDIFFIEDKPISEPSPDGLIPGSESIRVNLLRTKCGNHLPVELASWRWMWYEEEYLFYIAKDISALYTAYDRFFKLFEINPAMMVITNLKDNTIMDINSTFTEKLGFTREDIVGKKVENINIYKDYSNRKEIIRELMDRGYFKNISIIIRDKNGNTCDALYSGVRFNTPAEDTLLSVFFDISEMKAGENELIKQNNLILSLINSIPDLVFYKDLEGKYIGCNTAYCRFTGKTKEDIIGKTVHDFLSPEIADFMAELDRAVLKSNKSVMVEKSFNSGSPNESLMEILKAPYLDANGKVIGTVGIIRDITERKKKENEIKYLSFHDQLTGLYNRRFFEEELARLDTERNLPLSIIVGDVDNLKFINDSFGHASGDELLKFAGEAMKSGCRADDIIARVGGDEFSIILPNTDRESGESIIGRIEDMLSKKIHRLIDITVSFGIETKTELGQKVSDVIKRAENKMYQKKLEKRMKMRASALEAIDKTITNLHNSNSREQEHSSRAGALCESIALKMNLNPFEVEHIKLAGLLHDIGKVDVDETILKKKEGLSKKDWDQVRSHPEIGYRILSTSAEYYDVAQAVYEHHERWDGKGYPRGLKGEEILLSARIVAVAEAYDAMKFPLMGQPLSDRKIAEEFRRNAGTQFDPMVVNALLDILFACESA